MWSDSEIWYHVGNCFHAGGPDFSTRDMKLYEIVELKQKQDILEQKIMKDYNITHYTKYGLFRSHRCDGIYWTMINL